MWHILKALSDISLIKCEKERKKEEKKRGEQMNEDQKRKKIDLSAG